MIEAIKSFVAAQAGMGKALKDSQNPAFRSKYADLGSVQDACFPALNSNGFAVMQPNGHDEHGEFVETVFMHVSGERFSTRVYLRIGKNDMQGYGSAMTYARRYGLMNLAGIAPEDDDGNAAAKNPPAKRALPKDTGSYVLPAATIPAQWGDAPTDHPTLAESATRGIKDAWLDGIKDALPDGYEPRQMYEGIASALEVAFAAKKSPHGVTAQWDKRKDLIEDMRIAFPDLHQNVLDAFSATMRRFEPDDAPGDLRSQLERSLEMER